MNSLDLYAKIEPMIGFYDEYEKLYSSYLQLLYTLQVESVLDIGCGNGKLLKLLQENNFKAFGIERSAEMLRRAKKLGVDADIKELTALEKDSFDCALAVGDVLNYIHDDELDKFFEETANVIKDDGYFLADINTLEGFEVTDGVIVKDFEHKFLAIEAIFEEDILTTNITLFEKQNKEYKKHSGQVLQYYHKKQRFEHLKNFSLIATSPISMFGDEDEKLLMLFQKVT